jgi:hypothetical protein
MNFISGLEVKNNASWVSLTTDCPAASTIAGLLTAPSLAFS